MGFWELLQGFFLYEMLEVEVTTLNNVFVAMPVSYTHLDVYKRQVYNNQQEM